MRDSQSLLEQLLGSANGPIGVDDVHAVIGTGSEERIGGLLAAVAARDSARAMLALDAALAGGADPGGVLEQLLAALRDCLLASVGCGPDLLANPTGLGVDVATLGRELGTATILAMLQILDQALGRMRTSGHAVVLAEMAVVRLAALENLESLAAALDRVAAGGGPAAAPPPAREKKTPELTARAAEPPPEPRPEPRPEPQPPVSPPRPVASQAALMRAAADHPLVAHARTLFDGAIRKVEPARPREAAPASAPPEGGPAAAGESALEDSDA